MLEQNRTNMRHEDVYVKYDCQECKRQFIVGNTLSGGMNLTCPYCGSSEIMDITNSGDRDMEMGCMGIYYYKYPNGSLMLYTSKELCNNINGKTRKQTGYVNDWDKMMQTYCAERDKKSI